MCGEKKINKYSILFYSIFTTCFSSIAGSSGLNNRQRSRICGHGQIIMETSLKGKKLIRIKFFHSIINLSQAPELDTEHDLYFSLTAQNSDHEN
jgi:hypothetical protein